MEVYFDPQTFLRQRTGGISRLFSDLIREFDQDPAMGVEAVIPYHWTNNAIVAEELSHRGIRSTPTWLPRAALYAPWWLRGPHGGPRCAVTHYTYYSKRFLHRSSHCKQVTTVHDMIPELLANSRVHTGSHLAKRDYVHQSDLVICVSEATSRDLFATYGDVQAVVRVIPNAVSSGFQPGLDPLPSLPAAYVLYVGSRKGYKDFPLLIAALKSMTREGLDVPLVVAGEPFTPEEVRLIRDAGLTRTVSQQRMSDDELRRAYSNCVMVVQTSRYEGFGLTPLEGMASGAPVIVADASSMPEVGGDVAQYFSPGDAEDLTSVMIRTLTDETLRRELSRRGPTRAALFSTAQMARRTADAYAEILR